MPRLLITLCLILSTLPGSADDRHEVLKKKGHTLVVQRVIEPASLDWSLTLTYRYTKGELRRIRYDLRVTNAYDAKTDDFHPTRCVRNYRIKDGTPKMTSERLSNLESRQPEKRIFREPVVKHWFKTSEIPAPAQQD